ncbi:MAG TPA: PadR family transcriptional regulator [Clostridiaceae bacterium]|nr:PadR family transcriptional regulator [Clostridiaceae bacterium]
MNNMPALTETTYYILLTLYKPNHGYGIMQQVEELSGGRIRLAPGTLYGALTTMCDKGWITLLPVDEGSRKKEYKLTRLGLSILRNEIERLRELVHNGDMILGGSIDA